MQSHKVFGTVNHIPCTILFDTGSTISLISQQLVNQAKLPQSSSAQTVNVLTASCNDMVLNTTTDIPLKIDGFSANHKAFIAPQLVLPIILGTDFLSKFQVSLDFKRASITIGDTTITTDQTQKRIPLLVRKGSGITLSTLWLFFVMMTLTLTSVLFPSFFQKVQPLVHYPVIALPPT